MTGTNVEACVAQIVLGFAKSIRWISDGSASKCSEGKAVSVTLGKQGLRIKLDSDKVVSWRMSQAKAKQVIDSLKAIETECSYVELCYHHATYGINNSPFRSLTCPKCQEMGKLVDQPYILTEGT